MRELQAKTKYTSNRMNVNCPNEFKEEIIKKIKKIKIIIGGPVGIFLVVRILKRCNQ